MASNLTVAQKPLGHLTLAERNQIAHKVLERYMQGEQVKAMAKDFDTSDVTLYALLLREHQEPWKEIQVARALAKFERTSYELEQAPDMLSVTRARDSNRIAQWELERLLRRLYGQDQALASQTNVQINIGIRGGQPGAQPVDKTVDKQE